MSGQIPALSRAATTDQAIEHTMRAICRYWARYFDGNFFPDEMTPPDLALHLHDRFETQMQYLWLNAVDPWRLASEANLRANPNALYAFDSCPCY